MQLIKGGFSYRLKKELRYLGEVWQRKKRQGLYRLRKNPCLPPRFTFAAEFFAF